MTDHFKAIFKTDLDRNLNFTEETIEILDDKISVYDDNKNKILEIDNVEKLNIEYGISICKLIAIDKDGKVFEVAYFTKKKADNIRKIVDEFNLKVKTEIIEKEEERKRSKKEIYGFLMQIIKKYKKELTLSIIIFIIGTIISLIPPYLTALLINKVLISKTPSQQVFLTIIFLMLMSYISYRFLYLIGDFLMNITQIKIIKELRELLLEHIIFNDISFVEKYSPSRLISRYQSDIGRINSFIAYDLPSIITDTLMIIGTIIILFLLLPFLAIPVIITTIVAFALFIIYERKARTVGKKATIKSVDIFTKIVNILRNFYSIKLFSKEREEYEKTKNTINDWYLIDTKLVKFFIMRADLIFFIMDLTTVFIWYFGGTFVINNLIKLGILVAFISYTSYIYSPLYTTYERFFRDLPSTLISAERILELLEDKPKILNKENALKPNMIDEIKFVNVTFEYEPGFPVLKNISFTIKPKEKVAIVGKNGAGKTTIAKLLLRFYDVNDGEILIGNANIKDIDLKYLREKISYLSQEPEIFDNTIRYNISYGNPNVNEIEIIKVCKIVDIHDDIIKLPFAYDTLAGEEGTRLSGGQKQKIAIARNIIRNPDIFIFDELTSNIDAKSREQIFDSILNISKGKTLIYISHNLSEILNMDRVIVIEDGKIVEEGKPDELINKKGKFYELFKNQIENMEKIEKVNKESEIINLNVIKDKNVIIEPTNRPSRINVIYNGKKYENLMPKLLFPISNPKFVGFYDDNFNEIFLLEDYTILDENSRKILENAIRYNSIIYKIEKIRKIDVEGETIILNTIINNKELEIKIDSPENLFIFEDKILFIDENDNLYQIILKDLDKRSLKNLNKII
jgi:ATP-binding cassette subfamily C protein